MVNDRLHQLLDYYQKEPNDPFIVYGIALEYLKSDKEKALSFFEILLSDHPDYLATYYQAGELYHDLQHIKQAKEVYQKGIALATKQENHHTLRELKNAYQNFMFEEDLDDD